MTTQEVRITIADARRMSRAIERGGSWAAHVAARRIFGLAPGARLPRAIHERIVDAQLIYEWPGALVVGWDRPRARGARRRGALAAILGRLEIWDGVIQADGRTRLFGA